MWALAREWWEEQAGGGPPGPSQLYMLRRASVADDTLQTSTAGLVTSTMTILAWLQAVTDHDATAPTLIGWGAASAPATIDPGVLVRFNPSFSDRLEVFVGLAGTLGAVSAIVNLPGGATDISLAAPFLAWATINGTELRIGTGDPAGGNVSSPVTITGGIDTASTAVATIFGRLGTTARGMAGTMAVAVLGEVLSDAAIAAVAAAGASGPSAAAAASSAPLWCPRPLTGLVNTDPIATATDVEDTEGVYTHVLTAGTARLQAAS